MLEANEKPEEVIPLLTGSKAGDRILGLIIGGGWWGLYKMAIWWPTFRGPSGKVSSDLVFLIVLAWVLQIVLLKRFRTLHGGILAGTTAVVAVWGAVNLYRMFLLRFTSWI